MMRGFKTFPLVLVLLTLVMAGLVAHLTISQIGSSFPGYLTFKNGMVGAFYVPGWSGPAHSLYYHDFAMPADAVSTLFTQKDFILVVLVPLISGVFFILGGIFVSFFMPSPAARFSCQVFHFVAGTYLILSPEFHLTYHLTYLHLIIFAFLPAAMIHFAFQCPFGIAGSQKWNWVGYGISLFLAIPYLYFFEVNPKAWIQVEYAVVFYAMVAYFFWIGRLVWALRQLQFEGERIIARTILIGQVLAFIVPFMSAVLVFGVGVPVPLNLAAPFTFGFPLALLLGVLWGRLKQNQAQLLRSEKRAAFGGLVAGLAHELKNPLTFIYSNIEPLLEVVARVGNKELEQELNAITKNLEEGAERCLDLVNRFRTFSHPGSGKVEELDVNLLLKESIELLKPRWEHRIKIEMHYFPECRLQANITELEQVFVNLLANAFDAIAKEGTVWVETQKTDGKTGIKIADSGKGINKGDLTRLFDPFYTTKAPGEGTGLGLAITHEIIEKMKGTIQVKSEPGKGTEVIVTL